MRDTTAIALRDVTKTYRLFGSQKEQLLEVLGLNKLLFGSQLPPTAKEYTALSHINLEIERGARTGIVGRNGAGKTTLLKLICGNFTPTSGEVEVNGEVQALMGTGLGFHPEYTGRENALSSLQYNGLSRDQYEAALEDIIEFCELGDFIDQPFKTYSLGMQARLMFATSTAVRPDILIVDEVLGAGDGYFIAKSRQRMEKLVGGGCTMLLVSHSTQQVLEMCQQAVWLDKGKIRMQDEAFRVVKAYEEFVHGSKRMLSLPPAVSAGAPLVDAAGGRDGGLNRQQASHRQLQEPQFQPHAEEPGVALPRPEDVSEMKYVARGGLSRWDSEQGVKVCGFDIVGAKGSTNRLLAMEQAQIVIHLVGEMSGHFRCRYGLVINDIHGRCLSKVFSPKDEFSIEQGEVRRIAMLLNPLQIGPGDYTVGISVLEYGPLELLNSTRRYDLLGRSFEFRVELQDSFAATDCLFYHTAEWQFG